MVLPNPGSCCGTQMVLQHPWPSPSQLNLAGPSYCSEMSMDQWGLSGTHGASVSSRILLTAEKGSKVKQNLLLGTV